MQKYVSSGAPTTPCHQWCVPLTQSQHGRCRRPKSYTTDDARKSGKSDTMDRFHCDRTVSEWKVSVALRVPMKPRRLITLWALF